MGILRIRDADGTVREIIALKGDKGDPGEFTGGELLKAHINDKNNPHGSAPMSEIGDKEKIFICDSKMVMYHDVSGIYINKAGEEVDNEDCAVYLIINGAYMAPWRNRTVRIKTYMYGDMAIYDEGGHIIGANAVTNSSANITEDPESGIFEYEFALPEGVDEPYIYVSFCKNPYMDEPVIYEPKKTVWEELKKNVVETGMAPLDERDRYYYRRYENFTEIFGRFSERVTLLDDGTGEVYYTLPVKADWCGAYSVTVSIEGYGHIVDLSSDFTNEWTFVIYIRPRTTESVETVMEVVSGKTLTFLYHIVAPNCYC